MEVEDIHAPKRSRMRNVGGGGGANAGSGTLAAARLGQEQRQDDDDEDGEGRSLFARGGGGAVAGVRGLRPWQQHSTASRIYRVSRASGGKDRHSKVMTAKGLRDRRVRLSVSTAIQFYDLQDRLGYDQPSKAIEWLIKAAAAAIADLPALDGAFSNQTPSGRQPGDEEKPAREVDEDEEDGGVSQLQYTNHHNLQHQQEEHQTQQRPQQQQRLSLTKSTCSSTSETSKGSVLSLSRSEIRVKARERARERTATAKDKEKDKEDLEDDAHVQSAAHHQSMNPNPTSQSSFTELLTGGGHQNHTQHNHCPVTVAQAIPASNFIHKQLRQLPTPATASTTTDYFGQVGLLGAGQKPQQPNIFPTQTHFGSSSPMGMVPFNVAAATTAGDHPEMQQHYVQEHLIPFAVPAAGGDYINFSISSGFNRGTLQSNSPSPLLHHHLQMFSSPVDGSNLPFFLGAAASASGEGQLPAGFDSRLQLCYRHPDLKGKGKN